MNTPETNQDGYLQVKQFVATNCGIGTRAMVDEDDGQKELWQNDWIIIL
ncbi:MAG: hypothetical protein WB612_08560 [Nitrososphaeraceae archaeon]